MENIKHLIAINQTGEAVDLLLRLTGVFSSETMSALSVIKLQLKSLNQEVSEGRISDEEYQRKSLKISSQLIQIVESLQFDTQISSTQRHPLKMEELSEKLLYDLRRQVESAGLNMDPQAMTALTTIVNTGLDKNFQKSRSLESAPDLSQLSPEQQRMMEINSRIFADAIIRNAGSGTVEMDTLFKSVRMICPLWPIC